MISNVQTASNLSLNFECTDSQQSSADTVSRVPQQADAYRLLVIRFLLEHTNSHTHTHIHLQTTQVCTLLMPWWPQIRTHTFPHTTSAYRAHASA